MRDMNARFWTRVNGGWVKITLQQGQHLTHHSGGPTDEGYSYTATTWGFDGDFVTAESSTDAVDCDGRMSYYSEVACHFDDLEARRPWNPDNTWVPKATPAWDKLDSGQRDYSAEAAGY